MGRYIPWRLQEMIPFPHAWNRAFPMTPIGDRMEVDRIRIAFEDPVLATTLSPESLLPLVDLHKGVLKGILLKPLLSGKANRIRGLFQGLDIL